jgi:S-adenosyl-L-methionine hydrolase (adenosine-forming)
VEGDALLVVTLTSDFGEGSPYVAAMKAAVLRACPAAQVLDVSHAIEPFAIDSAAFVLWAGTRHFGVRSVHLAVVDPGVGGDRRRLAIAVDGRFYVGPDNGIFTVVLDEASSAPQAVELDQPAGGSATFEGRDVFAPAAGRLAAGASLLEIGVPIEVSALVHAPESPRVVWVDGFGNLVLSLRPPARPLRIGDEVVETVARTFVEAPPGRPFVYEGSMGRLEVAVPYGRADTALKAAAGTAVQELPDS